MRSLSAAFFNLLMFKWKNCIRHISSVTVITSNCAFSIYLLLALLWLFLFFCIMQWRKRWSHLSKSIFSCGKTDKVVKVYLLLFCKGTEERKVKVAAIPVQCMQLIMRRSKFPIRAVNQLPRCWQLSLCQQSLWSFPPTVIDSYACSHTHLWHV